jgi:hypothetical protein
MIFDILPAIGLASICLAQWISYRDRQKVDAAIVRLIDSKAETLQYQLDAQFKMIQELKNGSRK